MIGRGPLALATIALAAATMVADAEPKPKTPDHATRGSAILPGGNSKQPITIQATKLDYFDKEQKLVYTGNVIATQGDSKLKCSVLTIYLPPKVEGEPAAPASSNQVRRMEAQGPVTMVSKDQVGTGDSGVYDKARDEVVLTGHVTLSQGANVTKGDNLAYDLKTGKARVFNAPNGAPVISMFQP